MYTRSRRSGCGTLGAGCATENILDTRESAGGFRGGPGGLKAGKLLKKRLHSERGKKSSPTPSLAHSNPANLSGPVSPPLLPTWAPAPGCRGRLRRTGSY